MFTTHEPTVKATIAFLKCLKVKVNQATVNNTLQKSPALLLCEVQAKSRKAKAIDAKSYGANNFINFKSKVMKTTKMSLANIQGKLTRAEMKNIMAGDAPPDTQCYDSTCGGKKESGFGCKYPNNPDSCTCYSCL